MSSLFRAPPAWQAHDVRPGRASDTARWVRPSEQVVIADRSIESGLFYLGTSLNPDASGESDAGLIDPTLPAAPGVPGGEPSTIDRWPSYRVLAPSSRLVFLDWLASGRRAPDIDPHYVLLFIHGLERRLLQDRSTDDARDILEEMRSLMMAYGHHPRILKALRAMVDAAHLVLTGSAPPPSVDYFSFDNGTPIGVKLAVGRAVASRQPIGADLLLQWVVGESARVLPLPKDYELIQFRDAFRDYVARNWPDGVRLTDTSAPPLTFSYRAASGAFIVALDHLVADVPDLSRTTALLEAQTLVQGALEANAPAPTCTAVGPTVVAAPALDGADLAGAAERSGKAALLHWAREQLASDDSISLKAALRRLRGMSPKSLPHSEIVRLADALAQGGIGLVPDPRFDFEPPRATEDGLLFELSTPIESLEHATQDYKLALLKVMVGMSVARSDGEVSDHEVSDIDRLIASFEDLADNERARLLAERRWMTLWPLPLRPVFDALSRLTDRQKHDVANAAAKVAPKSLAEMEQEPTLIKTLFVALGKTPSELRRMMRHAHRNSSDTISDLGSGASHKADLRARERDRADDAGPPAVPSVADGSRDDAKPSSGSDMASADRSTRPLDDWEHEPPAMLSMASDATSPLPIPPDVTARPMAALTDLDGLDERHERFCRELMQQVEWNRMALEQLARNHRLMPDGAIEAINEWSFGTFSDRFFEQGDDGSVRLNRDIAFEKRKGAA